MNKLLSLAITATILTPSLAFAETPQLVVLNHTAAPATFCEGVRLDRSMTYHHFLQEFALDLDSQAKLAANQDLLKTAKLRAYNQQAPNVKRGQRALCGQESQNWND